MTVHELIAELSKHDPNGTAYVYDDGEPYEITAVEADSEGDVFFQ